VNVFLNIMTNALSSPLALIPIGRALLFLLPEETAFLKYLREAKVTLQEYEFPVNKVANIGTQTTMLVEKNYYLNKSARDAYRSYLLSYASHSHKDIFNVHELDLQGNISYSDGM
jgi:ATP-dependent RNA helicase DDX18/HAS1